MKTAYNVTWLLLMCSLAGCASLVVGGAATGVDPAGNDSRSVSEKNTDATITSAINAKYVHDNLVDAVAIRVNTYRGVVTLSGSVSSQTASARAVALARGTGNVKRVVSRLSVTP